MSQEM